MNLRLLLASCVNFALRILFVFTSLNSANVLFAQDSLAALMQKAADENRAGHYPIAIALLQKAIAIAPHDAGVNRLLGVAKLESGDPAGAIPYLKAAVAADAANTTSLGYLGDAEMELQDYAAAAETFESGAEKADAPEQAEVWWTNFALERYRNLQLILKASLQGRAALLEFAVEDPGLDAKAKAKLLDQVAALRRASKNNSQAPPNADQSHYPADGHPTEGAAIPDQFFARGMALMKSNDCFHAIPALERGLSSGTEVAGAHLAECYRREAVRIADRLQKQGHEASVHKIRGDILLSIRLDPVPAETEYKAALALNPGDSEILEKLSEAYFSEGKMIEAAASAHRALAITPHRMQTQRLLIRIAMSERNYQDALVLVDAVLQSAPGNSWARMQQATAQAQLGQAEQAAKGLQSLFAENYPDPKGTLHYLLFLQLRKLGRNEEAREAVRASAELANTYQQPPTEIVVQP